MRGVILYGPPASGKSTVTAILQESGDFALFQRLKAGSGNTTGYRMTTPEHLDRLRSAGQLLWENRRYGSTYAVDRQGLDVALSAAPTPILHLGQPEAIQAITESYPARTWLVVELWADLIDTETRLRQRGDSNREERLTAWADTPRLADPDLRIDTTQRTPAEAGEAIRSALARAGPPLRG